MPFTPIATGRFEGGKTDRFDTDVLLKESAV
jgi:hypothetical protein